MERKKTIQTRIIGEELLIVTETSLNTILKIKFYKLYGINLVSFKDIKFLTNRELYKAV